MYEMRTFMGIRVGKGQRASLKVEFNGEFI
jgi:hypothetical protein